MTLNDEVINFNPHWQMRKIDSAITDTSNIDGNRLEISIHHHVLSGVTPAMIVWWFKNFQEFPESRNARYVKYRGRKIPSFSFWHPFENIHCKIKKYGIGNSTGFSKGAEFEIEEKLGDDNFSSRVHVDRIDESGLELSSYKGLIKIAEFKHYFIESLNGTIYESSAVIGSYIPVFGRFITSLVRNTYFTDKMSHAWIRHTVEEVGNFEKFLPSLYEFGFENAFD